MSNVWLEQLTDGCVAAVALIVASVALGCGNAGPSGAPAGQAEAALSVNGDVDARIEKGLQIMDTGGSAEQARTALGAVIADSEVTQAQKDKAAFGVSRALEKLGDQEGAIAAIEQLFQGRPEGSAFDLRDAAKRRLRKLVTGSERSMKVVGGVGAARSSPFARMLSSYYPADIKGEYNIATITIGDLRAGNADPAAFRVGEAIKEIRAEKCMYCDDELQIGRHRDGYAWTGLVEERARISSTLTVVYFHLNEPIPRRYAEYVAMPYDLLVEKLNDGKGMIAARRRDPMPPLLLVAAPRVGQLDEVEARLAELSAIPVDPITVQIDARLKPEEIQSAVRSHFGAFRKCYEDLLRTEPKAEGKISLSWAIQGDGTVQDARVAKVEGLIDKRFGLCATDAARGLLFPASGTAEPVTVTYPIVFSPGDEAPQREPDRQ